MIRTHHRAQPQKVKMLRIQINPQEAQQGLDRQSELKESPVDGYRKQARERLNHLQNQKQQHQLKKLTQGSRRNLKSGRHSTSAMRSSYFIPPTLR